MTPKTPRRTKDTPKTKRGRSRASWTILPGGAAGAPRPGPTVFICTTADMFSWTGRGRRIGFLGRQET